jgi:muramoyltetrapeptide carboxypeptidase
MVVMKKLESSLIKPCALSPTKAIGVVAPSEPITPELLELGVKTLTAKGYRVKLGSHINSRIGYLAGIPSERADDFHSLLKDDDVGAIFFAAGGYNSAQLLRLLDFELIKTHPKIIMGLSDSTSLLNAIHGMTGLVTFHGPVVQYNFSSPMTDLTEHSVFAVLASASAAGDLPGSSEWKMLREGNARGALVGGNLSTLIQLVGTPYAPSWDGAILFWEDVCEQLHALEARLTHLKNAGILDRIAGMVIGQLVECEEADYPDPPSLEEMVLRACSDWEFPIIYNVPLGHTEEKLTLPIGIQAGLTSASQPRLRLLESAVV